MRRMELTESFMKVYDEHADAIYRFCVVRTGQEDVAHDLTQDTFMRFWRALQERGVIEYPRAFVYRIARNAIIDWYRKSKADSLDVMQGEGFEPIDPDNFDAEQFAEHAHILKTLAELPADYREVLVLRYVEALPPREIAEILGESTNVVSVRLNRATAALQKLLHIDAETYV